MPSCETILPSGNKVEGIVIQELADIALAGDKESLLLLDRAGNVFRYFLDEENWLLERTADMPAASSRQQLISVSAFGDDCYLLDTNVGQIWRHGGGEPEVLSVEMDLRESADFAVREDILVLAQDGYRRPLRLRKLGGVTLVTDTSFIAPSDLPDPSLLFLDKDPGGYLYLTDTGYQRLRVLEPDTGNSVRDYLLAEKGLEFRSVYATESKLYVATRDAILVYPREPVPVPPEEPLPVATVSLSTLAPNDPRILDVLPPLALPIEDTMLSDLAGHHFCRSGNRPCH